VLEISIFMLHAVVYQVRLQVVNLARIRFFSIKSNLIILLVGNF